jgi:hypothetical protein
MINAKYLFFRLGSVDFLDSTLKLAKASIMCMDTKYLVFLQGKVLSPRWYCLTFRESFGYYRSISNALNRVQLLFVST